MHAARARTPVGAGIFTGTIEASNAEGGGRGQWTLRDRHHVERGASLEYRGDWQHGVRHGVGVSQASHGTRYDGAYELDQRHGTGSVIFPDGAKYEGQFWRGIEDGEGRSVSASGAVYVGGFKNGRFHGTGELTMADGSVYTGTYKNGLRDGQGCFKWPGGECYEGAYHEDRRHGHGVYTWPDGRSFSGTFDRDRQHGHGAFTWPNGDRFEGVYANGRRSGDGQLTYADQSCDAGIWMGSFLVKLGFADSDLNTGPKTVESKKFLEAAKGNDLISMRAIMGRDDVYVDVADEHGRTALFFCAVYGHIPAMTFLLSIGAHVNILTDGGMSILTATYNRTKRSTHTLDRPGVTKEELHEQSREHVLWEAVLMLLDNNADPNIAKSPEPILHTAVRACDLDMVEKLLLHHANVEEVNRENGSTPMLIASKQLAKVSLVTRLAHKWQSRSLRRRPHPVGNTDWGVDPSKTRSKKTLSRAPHLKATANKLGIDAVQTVSALLKHDARPDVADNEGRTALHVMASIRGSFFDASVIKRAIMSSSSFDDLYKGCTAMALAIDAGNDGVAALMITHGADVDVVLGDKSVLLHRVARASGIYSSCARSRTNIKNLLKVLIDAGVDPFVSVPASLRYTGVSDGPQNVIDFLISKHVVGTESPPLALVETLMGTPIYKQIVEHMRRKNLHRKARGVPLVPMCEECGRRYGVKLVPWRRFLYCSEQCKMRSQIRAGNRSKSVSWHGRNHRQNRFQDSHKIQAATLVDDPTTDTITKRRHNASAVRSAHVTRTSR